MKKYTLKFTNPFLENLYQQQLQNTYIPFFYMLSLGIILGIIFSITSQYFIDGWIVAFELKISALIYIVLQLAIVKNYKGYAKYAIIPTNLILIIFQFEPSKKDSVYYFMAGQNFMMIHDIVMFVADFNIALINNSLLLILRILVAFLTAEQGIYYFGLFHALLAHSILAICFYKKCQTSRHYFLLSRQDQIWDTITPHLVSKPMFLFTYDENSLKFIPKKTIIQNFLQYEENPLLFFLRGAKVGMGNTSLENYIFAITKDKHNQVIEEFIRLKVKFMNQIKNISFAQFQLEFQTFIIFIEDEDLNYKQYKQQLAHERQNWQKYMYRLIRQQDEILKKVLSYGSVRQIIKLRIQFRQVLLLPKMDCQELELLNATLVIKHIINQFGQYSNRIRLLGQDSIFINTQKYLFYIFLLDLFKRLEFTQSLAIVNIHLSPSKQLTISIQGQLYETQSKIFLQVCSILVESIINSQDSNILLQYFQNNYLNCIALPIQGIPFNDFIYLQMNKYTLKFRNLNLEEQYQKQLQGTYIPLISILSIGAIVGLIFNILSQYFQNEGIVAIEIKLGSFIYMVSQLVIVKRWSRYAKYCLIPTNLILMTFQLDPSPKEPEKFFMAGQNFMCMHDIALFVSDFDMGAINNLLIFLTRIGLNILATDTPYYFGIFHAMVSHISMAVCLYKKCKQQRQHFLLSKQDELWALDKIAYHVVSKPLFIFTFDEENLKFILKKSILHDFLKDIENPLTYFLRESKLNGATLESHLFKIVKKSQNDNIQFKDLVSSSTKSYQTGESSVQLKVKFLDKTTTITLAHHQLEYQAFLIFIEDEDKMLKKYKKVKYYLYADQTLVSQKMVEMNIFNKLIQIQDMVINRLLKSGTFIDAIRLRFQYQQMLLLNRINMNQLEEMNITKVLEILIKQFDQYSRKIKLLTHDDIIIKTQKYMFLIFILDIFKRIKVGDTQVLFNAYICQNDQLNISIKAELDEDSSQLFQVLKSRLIESLIITKDRWFYKFHKEPLKNFDQDFM